MAAGHAPAQALEGFGAYRVYRVYRVYRAYRIIGFIGFMGLAGFIGFRVWDLELGVLGSGLVSRSSRIPRL